MNTNIRKEIKELEAIGRMPDESISQNNIELIEKYEALLCNIKAPINFYEAEILIQLFPEKGLFGLEWTLLHLIETLYNSENKEQYKNLIQKCPSKEWKEILIKGIENALTRRCS